jgi:hypothetical protein
MRELRDYGVKSLEHFTERTEEGGGHGEVVVVEAAEAGERMGGVGKAQAERAYSTGALPY